MYVCTRLYQKETRETHTICMESWNTKQNISSCKYSIYINNQYKVTICDASMPKL